ncbi:MAG: hypothetical protein IJN48_04995 [Clostridia bacterium]|nr:hypothetical protein [Clostridia bacterium]
MTETIAKLWNGNLEPVGNFGVNNDEMKDLEDIMGRCLEKIEKALNEEQKKIFQAYQDDVNEYILVATEQAFCDGYCLGTKITTEALMGAEVNYNL